MNSFFKNMVLCALFAVLFSTNIHSMQSNSDEAIEKLNTLAMKFQDKTRELAELRRKQNAKQELIATAVTASLIGNQDTCSCPSAETTEAKK